MQPCKPKFAVTTACWSRSLTERVADTADERAARHAYRRSFNRLRSQLSLYPAGSRPSQVFESAAATARSLGATCLPLAIAVAMHLYPFCVLQCVPIPLLGIARLKRALLLRTIRRRSLLLANTGSERIHGTTTALIATRAADGVYINGRCEYLSLSSIADVVLFKADLADTNHTVLCAADLRASIGARRALEIQRRDGALGYFVGDVRRSSRAQRPLPDRPGSRASSAASRTTSERGSTCSSRDLPRASRAPARHMRVARDGGARRES